VRTANALRDECPLDGDEPDGFKTGSARISAAIGTGELAVRVYELPPGETLCPYHYEYSEEWMLVLDGAVHVRTPEGEVLLAQGAIVCFAPGPDGAHTSTNRGDVSARVMMFSSAREPAVAVYPDSDKVGVWPGNEADRVMLHRRDGAVDYWDGERGPA
jgi:uncharacterized cupin superfamily protein